MSSTTDKVVFIPVEGEIQEFYPETIDEALRKANELLNNVVTDCFRGKLGDEIGIFLVDDTGLIDGLPVNPRASEAYLKCCRPGTVASIHGDAVGLFGRFAE